MSPLKYQQYLAVVTQLLKGNHDSAKCILQDTAQLSEFLNFIERQGLRLCFFSLLEGSAVREALPRAFWEQQRRFSLRQWVTQEILVRELAHLSSLLAAAGHEFISLKGPCLAARFWGGIDRRTFSDLDILVRRQDLAAIEVLLHNAGYVRRSTVLFNIAMTSRFVHALDFVKPQATLDLHWRLTANPAHALDYESIWKQRRTFTLCNQPLSVLSDEYEVVFSLVSIFKNVERGAARLKEFVDLYFILSSVGYSLDWEQFLEHRRRERILAISVNILAMFLEVLDCRDKFAQLAAAVNRHKGLLRIVSRELRQTLLEATPGALKNKLWAAPVYDCSAFQVFVWWFVSLPFRLAAHDARWNRLRSALQFMK
jgi:hypothetical protein